MVKKKATHQDKIDVIKNIREFLEETFKQAKKVNWYIVAGGLLAIIVAYYLF